MDERPALPVPPVYPAKTGSGKPVSPAARFSSYRGYLTRRFGAAVLKVPINGGFSCPNRDGTKGRDGCDFCDNAAFSPASQDRLLPLAQFRLAKQRAVRHSGLFLPYLQPFSNTYGPVEKLAEVYEPLLAESKVVGLSIGTRPDCLTPAVIGYLAGLARGAYICVELGLQSAHDTTLRRVNRGHTYGDFVDAVGALAECGIESVAHVMIGLPGEDAAMALETARRLASLPVCGVKLHQLMVIRGTACASQYRTGELRALPLEEYADTVCEFLRCLRPDQHIHRLVADSSPARGLVAPLWSADKAYSLAYIHSRMEYLDMMQGDRR